MEEQLELLREIRNQLIKKHGGFYLCNIYAEIRNIQMYDERWIKRRHLFEEEIPLFTFENAFIFNALNISLWWHGDNLRDRLAFIDWMIERYSQSK